ncbi:XdhC/CoxI family protein [Oscillospiraceae bacterium PP1C4]
MSREFYSALAQTLKSGGSAHLISIVSGTVDGRDLTAQKALLQYDKIIVQDEQLRAFWRNLIDAAPLEPVPCIAEVDGFKLLIERLASRQRLVICGAGHIAQPLASLGTMLDFDVTVIDERVEFANAQRFPTAKEIICAPFAQAMEQLDYTENTYFVVVTRGHSDDRLCLEQILNRRFAYVGMIGSRRKTALVMEQMEREGYKKELLEQVYAPIGLKIGAQTPAEIAVCIAGEIIQVRSGSTNGDIDPEALDRLAQGVPMMLATIIQKQGSAPRSLGAKLLVDEDGKLYGTIGGGKGEAMVIAMAKDVLASKKPHIMQCNMTNDDARKAGMICGGVITVLMEAL